MHNGLVDQDQKFKKRIASSDTSDYRVVDRGQLVVGFPIDEGVLSFQNKYDHAIVSPAYGIWNIAGTAAVIPAYLERFLRSPEALRFYRTKLRGSTARRRSLPKEVFLSMPIPLPSLPEQRRIAAIFDHADALHTKRRESLARLGELARSIFVEMFGDPNNPDDSAEFVKLSEICAISSGSTPSRSNSAFFNGSLPWVKTAEVVNAPIKHTSENISMPAVEAARLRIYPVGSIVVAMYGQGATRGRVGILEVPATTNQACAVLEPSTRVHSRFLFEQLKISYDRLRNQGRGGTQPNLNGRLVADFKVFLPTLDRQKEFLERNSIIDALKLKLETHSQQLELLSRGLQSRAFSGQL